MSHFEIQKSSDGQFFFLLKAGNGEIIVTSELYTSKQSCNNGIESLKTTPTEAEVRELT
ncbi:DUF1508 domain-containing protein [Halobacillus shinanisalinarum]|uniref:DUF1508 domain-containing protein n=1 Tax=Halobacillus shinanisalinarum TaxID=2932258 RepID=A0ABY4GVY6_9BACI|nr:DUF1508 domain-containing protein [Halobacillus shinanisalinarum]UOQ92199.1 DUF1508 domain-containing protein [Halobacillus shinanisalinarum]